MEPTPLGRRSPRHNQNIVQNGQVELTINPIPIDQYNTDYGQSMVQPQMPYQQRMETDDPMVNAQHYNYQPNNDDRTPSHKRNQPDQTNGDKGSPRTKKLGSKTKTFRSRTLKRKESERDTYFFGILSRKHGFCTNLYRLFVAFILLPCTLCGLLFACIGKAIRKCFKWITRVCCAEAPGDKRRCCYGCLRNSRDVEFWIDLCLCNWKGCETNCTKCYGESSECCVNCIDGCGVCCTSSGESCGHCLASIGHGVCDCFNGAQDICSNCLEGGKDLFTGCMEGIGKLCCLGVETLTKCVDSAGSCYSTCCQCGCDWDICDTVHKCCECGVDLSGCGDCAGECCGGSVVDCCECLQSILCHLIEVIGGICQSFGFICECLECIFK